MQRILQRLSGWLVLGVTRLLRALPLTVSYAVADLAVPVLLLFTWIHERRVAPLGRGLIRNLRIAFRDELSPRRERRLLLAWARHMTRVAVDFCRIPRITAANIEQFADVRDVEGIRAVWQEGNGASARPGNDAMHTPELRAVGSRGQ